MSQITTLEYAIYLKAYARALLGDLATRGPRPEEGAAILDTVVPILDGAVYRIPVMWFLTSLAEGQLRMGGLEAALATIETSLARHTLTSTFAAPRALEYQAAASA